MPRYRVELEIQTSPGRPDETFTATVDAEDSEIALATAKVMALRNGCRGRVTLATCHRIEDDETTVDDTALPGAVRSSGSITAQRFGWGKEFAPEFPVEFPVASEAMVVTRLSDEQSATLSSMAKSLAPGCGVRLALELAIATDRAQKIPAPKAHDFGKYDDMAFCKRSGCQAANTRPANRWGCKGEA